MDKTTIVEHTDSPGTKIDFHFDAEKTPYYSQGSADSPRPRCPRWSSKRDLKILLKDCA